MNEYKVVKGSHEDETLPDIFYIVYPRARKFKQYKKVYE